MPKSETPNDLITLREAAAILGISYPTAKRWSCDGRIPAPVKIYGRTCKRWSRAEIERFGNAERDDDDK